MATSTRPATPGPSTPAQNSKRIMSDAESAPQDPKKARRNSSTEPSTRHDTNRETKRRRKKKKKVPIVAVSVSKSDGVQSQPDERTRAPLSVRNEIIRFTSAPPDPDHGSGIVPPTDDSSQTRSSKSLCQTREGSHDIHSDAMPPIPSIEKCATPADGPSEPLSSRLEDKIVQLEAVLKSKNDLIASHLTLLNQVQQAVMCQVCLDLMYKPYALAPCGHLACHSCLVNWFTAPPPDNRQAPPAIRRKKTCPHCRAVVRERPVEVWGVKSVALAVGKSGLLSNQLPVPAETPESLDAGADPWKDIFSKPGTTSHHRLPWFLPGVDVDDVDVDDLAGRGEDMGMLDMEDGGIYRCLDCMHEIWDGVCSSCGRVYPGHGPEDDDEDEVGWLDDQMGAEEVNLADDPGWMGLEDGEADDGDDMDEWHSFSPLRHQLRMFAPWFLGEIDVDEEDEDDIYSGDDGGYESSFIDDDEGGIAAPRIYEIGSRGSDDEDEALGGAHRQPAVVASSDEDEIGSRGSDDEDEAFGGAHRQPAVVASSDEEDVVCSHSRRARRVESDESEAYWSDA